MQEFWVHKFFVTNKIFLGPHFFNNFLKNTFFLSNCSPRMKCMTDFEFGTKTKLLKLKPHPPSPGWLSTIPRLFTYHPRDSQPSNSTRSLTLAQPSLSLFISPEEENFDRVLFQQLTTFVGTTVPTKIVGTTTDEFLFPLSLLQQLFPQ